MSLYNDWSAGLIVATWNVNSIRVRQEQVESLLKTANIDVLLLQELKCITEAFPQEPFEDAGYNCSVFGQKTYNGVAIVSRSQIEDVTLGIGSKGDARYISTFTNGIRIASVYVPNGQEVDAPAFKYKFEFLRDLKEQIKKEIDENGKFIVGGDFNIAPNDIDVYDPEKWADRVCFTKEERVMFSDILNETTLIDTFRELNPETVGYSWWDYRHSQFAKNKGLRLDHILATPNIRIKTCHVDVGTRALEKPSDHAPVILEIDE